jgi:hypothetical protein
MLLPDASIAFALPVEWTLALDRALTTPDRLAPAGKEPIVGTPTSAIGADGVVGIAEAELLRTVCAALHRPPPPLLQVGKGEIAARAG